MKMGLFGKRDKKDEKKPDGITTKSPDQIQSEQLNTELQSIRNEIQTKKFCEVIFFLVPNFVVNAFILGH